MEKHTIINLKIKVHSNRIVERMTGINRKPVVNWKAHDGYESIEVYEHYFQMNNVE